MRDLVVCTGCNGSGKFSSNVASSWSGSCSSSAPDSLRALADCKSCHGRGYVAQRYPIRGERDALDDACARLAS